MYIGLHVKYQLLLSHFTKLEFCGLFSEKKILKRQISWKSVQWEPSCSVWTDGRTYRERDMTKLIIAVRNFANAPKTHFKNVYTVCIYICIYIYALICGQRADAKDLNSFCVHVLWTVPWPMERAVQRWADTDWRADTPTDWLVCWHTNRQTGVLTHQQTDWCADTPTDWLVCWHTNRLTGVLTHQQTDSLTSRVRLDTLILPQLVKKFSTLYGNCVHNRAHNSPTVFSTMRQIDTLHTLPSYLILYCYLHLGHPSGLLPSDFPAKHLLSHSKCHDLCTSYSYWLSPE